jgi:FkbM family methyltransferase
VPVAFADNDSSKIGTEVGGLPVISPDEVVTRVGGPALIVVTVYNCVPILRQLSRMGLGGITYAQLGWALGGPLVPYCGIQMPHLLWDHLAQIRHVGTIWADEKSRQEYLGQLRWSLTLDPLLLPPHDDPADTYFDPEVVRWGADEVFLDCGAFDGDSIQAFIERCPRYKKAIALEPDPQNRSNFLKRFGGEKAIRDKRIELLPYAVSDKREWLTFSATGTAGSAFGGDGMSVEAVSIDSMASHCSPSFIKMDIEGAEPEALRGASRLMQDRVPSIAACLYHDRKHLWEIPLLIKAAQPSYQLFLRRYADECWETLCYARSA